MASLLDFSPIQKPADRTGEIWGRTIAGVGQQAAGAIQELGRQKQQRIQNFTEQMKFNSDISSDADIRMYMSNEWDRFKDKWLPIFQERKTRLTPQDKVDMQADLQAYRNVAGQLNQINAMWPAAVKQSTSQVGLKNYEANKEQYAKFRQLVRAGEGDLNGLMDEIQSTNTGIPFVNFKQQDPQGFAEELRDDYREEYAKPGVKETFVTDKEGKRYTREDQVTTFGDEQKVRDYVGQQLLTSPYASSISNSIQEQLTPEEQGQAVKQYEGKVASPFVAYWLDNKFDTSRFLEEEVKAGRKVAPAPERRPRKGQAGYLGVVPEVDGVWDIRGDVPKAIKGEIKVAYKDGRKVDLIGKANYPTRVVRGAIPQTDLTGTYVEVLVPKQGSNLEKRLAMGDITQDEFLEASSDKRNVEIYQVPYKDLEVPLRGYEFEGIGQFEHELKSDPSVEFTPPTRIKSQEQYDKTVNIKDKFVQLKDKVNEMSLSDVKGDVNKLIDLLYEGDEKEEKKEAYARRSKKLTKSQLLKDFDNKIKKLDYNLVQWDKYQEERNEKTPEKESIHVERQTKDGRIAIFDANTKEFIKWKE